jgi:hypothetical protein
MYSARMHISQSITTVHGTTIHWLIRLCTSRLLVTVSCRCPPHAPQSPSKRSMSSRAARTHPVAHVTGTGYWYIRREDVDVDRGMYLLWKSGKTSSYIEQLRHQFVASFDLPMQTLQFTSIHINPRSTGKPIATSIRVRRRWSLVRPRGARGASWSSWSLTPH